MDVHTRLSVGIACGLAFLIAAGAFVGLVGGQMTALPIGLVSLAAGIGILRRLVWSAYGFALYLVAQLAVVALLILRANTVAPGSSTQILLTFAACAGFIAAFVWAGRSLARLGGAPGLRWPWISVAALSVLPFLFLQPFVIPTSAMENTLLVGDHILVRRFPKPTPARGDLIVFTYPVDPRQTFVKRIIGMPGDRLRLDKKIVLRNGARLDESYALHRTEYLDIYRDEFPSAAEAPYAIHAQTMLRNHVVSGEVVVPPGHYFVMGDNRDNSLDSRYWGFVPEQNVVGKPVMIYGSEESPDHPTGPEEPAKAQSRTRWERLFKRL